jgi:hypothetical protein
MRQREADPLSSRKSSKEKYGDERIGKETDEKEKG